MKSTVLLCDRCNGTQTFALEHAVIKLIPSGRIFRLDLCAEHVDAFLPTLQLTPPKNSRRLKDLQAMRIHVRAYISKHGKAAKAQLFTQFGKPAGLTKEAFYFHIYTMLNKKLIKRVGKGMYAT